MALYRPRPVPQPLPALIAPTPPPRDCRDRVAGFTRTRGTTDWTLSPEYAGHVGVVQRMLASYALGYQSRAQIALKYGYSERQVQSILTGSTLGALTRPVRDRLVALGVCNERGHRSFKRDQEVRAALERVAVLAADMLRDWSMYTNDQRQEVATDLYLLSGAWREATA